MEQTYNQYLEEERKIAKSKIKIPQVIIICLLVIIAISGAYIYTELPKQDVEVIKNESLILGFNAGVEQWNAQVISKVNNDAVIPYYYNQTYYELNIAQLCSGVQND